MGYPCFPADCPEKVAPVLSDVSTVGDMLRVGIRPKRSVLCNVSALPKPPDKLILPSRYLLTTPPAALRRTNRATGKAFSCLPAGGVFQRLSRNGYSGGPDGCQTLPIYQSARFMGVLASLEAAGG